MVKRKNWIIRTVILIVLFIIFFVTNNILNNLEKKQTSSYHVCFKLPLPEKVAAKFKIPVNPQIIKVIVAGHFSGWDSVDDYYKMEETASGVWKKQIRLTSGDNEYKFVVYIQGRKAPLWIYDVTNPDKVNDSHGGFNSVIRIPSISDIAFIFNGIIIGLLVLFSLYFLFEPVVLWILHLKMEFRTKLVISMVLIVILSNVVFIVYHIRESRELIKQGIVDNVNIIHLVLKGEGVNFKKLASEKQKIEDILRKFFWKAGTRIEKTKLVNRSTSLSDLIIFDKEFNIISLMNRKKNIKLQKERAIRYGYKNISQYFKRGLLSSLIKKAGEPDHIRQTLFGEPPDKVVVKETDKTKKSISMLGYQVFLHPIMRHSRLVGYYGGVIQVKMFAGELKRILLFNIFILLIVTTLSLLLLASIGKVITRYLSKLAAWTKRIIQGDFSSEEIISSRDEIQVLAENFNTMRKSLQESFRKIEEKNRLLKIDAYLDNLTCLPNRQKMLLDLKKLPCNAVMLFNIDSFRGVNDFFGNEVGDYILKDTAGRLINSIQNEKLGLYKLGADDYVITVHKPVTPDALEQMAGVFCDHVMEEPFKFKHNVIYISVTAGLAIQKKQEDHSILLTRAGLALKAAKKLFLRHMLFRKNMEVTHEYKYNMKWTNLLKKAIHEERIVPFFQAIVNNNTGKTGKYECLVRMIDKDGSIICPGDFLTVSKEARFYRFLTRIMLKKSMEKFEDKPFEFSINLSIEDILDRRTHGIIIKELKAHPQTAKRLVFEIVETAEIENYEVVREFIDQVKQHGCKIAIDDFGAGYSNFEHIMHLNIDFLKIDASLIKNMDKDENSRIITRTIADFAKKMGIKTIAEYVHSRKVQDRVIEFGIDYSQGYYFGEPGPDIKE